MKIPFLDLYVVRGKNVLTDVQLKEIDYRNKMRNIKTAKLLDKIEHLKLKLKNK